jgi:hypothetical protein
MAGENNGKEDRQENSPNTFMLELLEEAMKLIRAALKEGRPHGIAWEAKRLYEGSDDPGHKSEATEALSFPTGRCSPNTSLRLDRRQNPSARSKSQLFSSTTPLTAGAPRTV